MASSSAAEFLNNVLLRPGPSQLPYPEDAKWTIRQHVLDLTKEFDNIRIKIKSYTQPDGRPMTLLFMEGTIPIFHRGTQYNIPIVIWLPERYPRAPPYFYVTPTPDMQIKANHSFVDPNGLVRSVYFHNWTFPTSNLNEMAHDMAIQFGSEPPLFTKPPGWVGPPSAGSTPPPPPQSVHSAALGTPPAQEAVAMHNPLQAGQQSLGWGQQVGPTVTRPPARPTPPAPTTAQLEEAFRSAAIPSLAERLQQRHERQRAATDRKLCGVQDAQQALAARRQQLEQATSSCAAERDALERTLQELAVRSVELDSWLDEYGKQAPASTPPDPDSAIVPVDALSSRALEAHAADLAIEEVLYALDKAIKRGTIQPDVYLKQVRQLCRRQYFARALGNKVAQQQRRAARSMTQSQQQLVTNTALHMPQGDSWVSTGVLSNPLAAMR